MLDAQDIQKLTEVLATKEDFRRVEDRVAQLDATQREILTILD
jgi:hypothetical protein